jgi:hypothetical protein
MTIIERISILIIVTIFCGVWFYWALVRPSNIRQKCNKEANLSQSPLNYIASDAYQASFEFCLDKYGLKR